tara:strand:- start:330 stop:533 length:204 start_codon:yes stop_codon:yes gene_type:complete
MHTESNAVKKIFFVFKSSKERKKSILLEAEKSKAQPETQSIQVSADSKFWYRPLLHLLQSWFAKPAA